MEAAILAALALIALVLAVLLEVVAANVPRQPLPLGWVRGTVRCTVVLAILAALYALAATLLFR